MKITNSLLIALILILACSSKTETSGQKVTFGIHEIAETNELSEAIMNTVKSMNVRIEVNKEQFVIGYITDEDTSVLNLDLSDQRLRIIRTIFTVDKEQKYYAVMAIRTRPELDNTQIKKAKADGNNIEIYFNLEGAIKWANLTKANIGRAVAFVIDNRVYSMPFVNAEIKNGMAIISGMSDETTARRIAGAIVTSDE